MTMQDAFSLKALFPRYDGKDLTRVQAAGDGIISFFFSIFICIVGLVGNGNIIWLLGFRIKRKPFAIYILNLAVADVGVLVSLLPLHICLTIHYLHKNHEFLLVRIRPLLSLFWSINSIRHLLLAAISVDRSVSVLFSNCYQCHQSPVLSGIVCAFIWALPFALFGVPSILFLMNLIPDYGYPILWDHHVTGSLCFVLVIISTLTLFINVCSESQSCLCGDLSKVIVFILLSSLLITILADISFLFPQPALVYTGLWASLESSINPLIYFLAGRQSGGKFQQRMKVIFQRVFKEERDTRMERPPRTQTSHL